MSRRQLATVYNFVANSLEVGDGIAATISLSRNLAKLDSFRCCKNCPHQRILAVGAMALINSIKSAPTFSAPITQDDARPFTAVEESKEG